MASLPQSAGKTWRDSGCPQGTLSTKEEEEFEAGAKGPIHHSEFMEFDISVVDMTSEMNP